VGQQFSLGLLRAAGIHQLSLFDAQTNIQWFAGRLFIAPCFAISQRCVLTPEEVKP